MENISKLHWLNSRIVAMIIAIIVISGSLSQSNISIAGGGYLEWDGGGGDGLWETCTNWVGDSCPTAASPVAILTETTVTLNAGTSIGELVLGNPGDGSSATIVFNYDALNIDGAAAPLVVTNASGGTGNVQLVNSSKITHTVNTTANQYNIYMTVTGNLTVGASASIDVDASGCPSATSSLGRGPNLTTGLCTAGAAGAGGNPGDGAGYGGEGGRSHSNTSGGNTYGNSLTPQYLGSGGGGDNAGVGGKGGGAVRLDVSGAMTLDGTITADSGATSGESGASVGSGGSGGSVYLTVTGNLNGSGLISADGGDGASGTTDAGGGGGGGRISVTHGGGSFSFSSSSLTAAAGSAGTMSGESNALDGAKGTVYTINSLTDAVTIYHGFSYAETDHSYTSWTMDSSATNQYCSSGIASPSVSATNLSLGGTITCSSTSLTSFNFSASSSFSVTDGFILDLSSAKNSADVDFNIPAGDDQTWNNILITLPATQSGAVSEGGTFTIDDAASLSLTGTTTISASTILTNLTGFSIASTSGIDASGYGCIAASSSNGSGPNSSNVCATSRAGTGYGANGAGAGGGGYGGAGGIGAGSGPGAGGAAYGTLKAPVLIGSSGGSDSFSYGGSGGGLIEIDVAGNVVWNGALSTNGGTAKISGASAGGGGSGGAIYINTTGSVTGSTGTASASGGTGVGGSNYGGGGGGGRIAVIYADTDNTDLPATFTDAIETATGTKGGGAAGDGSAGEVYISPIITSATTSINGGGSTVNRLTLNFNKQVDITDSGGAGDGLDNMSVSITSGETSNLCSIDNADYSTVNVTSLILQLTCSGAAANNTALTIDPAYTTVGSSTIDDDDHSQATEIANSETVTGRDGTAPAFVSATTSSITNIQIQMSEALGSVVFGQASGWTATSLTSTNAVVNGGDSSIIDLTMDAVNRGFTSSDFAFTSGEGGSDIQDSAGNSTASFLSKAVADGVAPDAPGSFAKNSGSGTTAVMTWTATSDTNFGKYEIWYGTNQSDVQGKTGTAATWDNANDANLATRTTTTTTITGLTAGNTYYALICAVDAASNSGCSSDISFVTNQTPTVTTPTSISQASDGTGYVTFSTTVADADGDETKLKVEYSEDGGSSWYDADLVSATPDQGAVDLDDAQTYQIGTVDGIDTDTADTTLVIIWDSKSASNGNGAVTGEQSDIQVRVTANDSIIDSSVGTSTSFALDNGGPSGLASFAAGATTSSTIVWSWTAATSEGSFDHYEIWYGENQSDVNSRTGTAIEWDNSDDAGLATMATATTTITGLTENTTYYAKIWAIDTYGNETTLSAATANNNGKPTLSALAATQATDASGDVTIQFTIDDADDDDTLQALIEYNIGASWVKLNLSELSASTSASVGTPDVAVENDNTYQVGNAAGYILSSGGANTIRVLWPTLSDGGSAFDTTTAQIRITPYDGTEAGSAVILTGVTLDNTAPSGLAGLGSSNSNNTLGVGWTAASDTNFDYYEIWYGTNASDVTNRTGTASQWQVSDDSNLSAAATTSTVITGVDVLSPGIVYYVKIVAIDSYGNESTLSLASFSTGVVGASSSGSSGSSQATAKKVKEITSRNSSNSVASEEPKTTVSEGTSDEVLAIEIKVDTDRDGLTDDEEAIYGTDPRDKDTDHDGINDGLEVNQYKTNPLNSDSDNDGFVDRYELINLKSDPNNICSPGNTDLDPEILKSCKAQYNDPNSELRRVKKKQLFVGVPKEIAPTPEGVSNETQTEVDANEDKPVPKSEDQVFAEEAPVKALPEDVIKKRLDKINEAIELALRPMKGDYSDTQEGKIRESIETIASKEAPWSEKHFKVLLKNKVIAENVDKSEELAAFITEVVSDPNKPVSQLDSLKLVVITTLPSEEEPTLESIISDFNRESLKVAEARQLFVSSEDLNVDANLTRGEALSLLFKIGDSTFRSEFINSTIKDLDKNEFPFKDVKITDKYAPYILYFYKKGYVGGYSDGTFRPNESITNAEFVKLLNMIRQESVKNKQAYGGLSLQTTIMGGRIRLDSIDLEREDLVDALNKIVIGTFMSVRSR